MDAGLEIIPVLNKIDLPGAEPERRKQEVHDLIGADPDEILLVSAKEGLGIPELLEAIVARVPPPSGDPDAPLRALIFDSYYDRYRGASRQRARRRRDDRSRGCRSGSPPAPGQTYEVAEVGYNQLRQVETDELGPGEVGYVVANVRTVKETRAGDTILDATRPDVDAAARLQGRALDGVRRALPHGHAAVRDAARRAREAPAQRRFPALRAGNVDGARLRLPLRLSRVCCTWRSSRSGSSASSIWTS